MRALCVVVLVGCTSQTLPDGPCAVEDVTGTIPGVTLTIRGDSCVFQRGSGGRFTYEVTATADAPAIMVPDSGGGCSSCRAYSSDPISFTGYLISGMSSSGEHQQYCLCDQGCCAPTQERMIELDVMTSSRSFEWSGRTWSGPSDTGNPMGAYFLPGRYEVQVGFSGFAAGTISAALPIEVID